MVLRFKMVCAIAFAIGIHIAIAIEVYKWRYEAIVSSRGADIIKCSPRCPRKHAEVSARSSNARVSCEHLLQSILLPLHFY